MGDREYSKVRESHMSLQCIGPHFASYLFTLESPSSRDKSFRESFDAKLEDHTTLKSILWTPSKDCILFDITHCQCLIATTRVSLIVNIIVQRLDIDIIFVNSSTPATITANINSIPMLNGTNFKNWKGKLLVNLGSMELDYALRQEQPSPITAESTPDEKMEFERWDRSNRMSLMIMQQCIPEAFGGTKSEEITKAKDFLDAIEKRFARNDKAEMTSLLASLMSMKYKGRGNVRECIMEMYQIASKLKALKIELFEDLLVLMVLISFPAQFNQFKISYNCQREKLTLNELISHCVQEKERLKQDKTESAHLASASKDKGKKRKSENEAAKGPTQKKQQKDSDGCFFCNKLGHVKKNCTKYHAWRVKKGLPELPKAK
ncbi:uncharacterized protein LOC133789783 [Humulus lupulus]|uniref:uncharacterized protein LOC133789783 n=1 Tax=Humulus lupulus TaxID=3486 RepID=UPI002B417632|nr:uncharacterized protein LOC133789783 [Humulus lupulus]